MKDPRVAKLADVLVGYSTHVQPGEKVLVEAYDVPDEVVTALVERVAEAGGLPFVTVKRNSVLRALYQNASEEQMRLTGEFERRAWPRWTPISACAGPKTARSCRTCPTSA